MLLLLLLLSRFSRVQLCATPEMASHQVPPSLGFQYTPNRDRIFSAVYNTGPDTVLSVCVLSSHSYEAGTAASTLILQTMNLKCKR